MSARLEFAVIGDPVQHSLSPRLFRILFDELGIEGDFRALKTGPEQLSRRVQSVRAGDLAGLSVTLPHKESIIPLLDELSPLAGLLGAVNCVAPSGARVIGHNTDGRGFELALERSGVKLGGARVLILGAGGAARAAAFTAAQAGASSVAIANRTPSRGEALATDLVARGLAQLGRRADGHAADSVSTFGPRVEVSRHSPAVSGHEGGHRADDSDRSRSPGGVESFGRSAAEAGSIPAAGCVLSVLPLSAPALAGERADIVVNSTSVGLDSSADPLPESFRLDGTRAVLDMVYRPLQTRLLSRARAVGTMAIDGVWMLVYQALEQLRIWTSRSVPAEVAARLHSKLCEEAG